VTEPAQSADAHIQVSQLTMAYGDFVVQKDLDFSIRRSQVFVLMGDSGCGKSTLLRHMIGLKRPAEGDVRYEGESFWGADDRRREEMMRSSAR